MLTYDNRAPTGRRCPDEGASTQRGDRPWRASGSTLIARSAESTEGLKTLRSTRPISRSASIRMRATADLLFESMPPRRDIVSLLVHDYRTLTSTALRGPTVTRVTFRADNLGQVS